MYKKSSGGFIPKKGGTYEKKTEADLKIRLCFSEVFAHEEDWVKVISPGFIDEFIPDPAGQDERSTSYFKEAGQFHSQV